MSPSTRRVWIEIIQVEQKLGIMVGHPPHGGCGLKFFNYFVSLIHWKSPSTRRVWIEILTVATLAMISDVTLHTEGVDWNRVPCDKGEFEIAVTLHTEGVDWNLCVVAYLIIEEVTLHTEGVDWNLSTYSNNLSFLSVTLHTEGVDWNRKDTRSLCHSLWSPSTRRVWIEIFVTERL